jgi:hypothetical protein
MLMIQNVKTQEIFNFKNSESASKTLGISKGFLSKLVNGIVDEAKGYRMVEVNVEQSNHEKYTGGSANLPTLASLQSLHNTGMIDDKEYIYRLELLVKYG